MSVTIEARLGRGTTTEAFAAVLSVGGERMNVVVKKLRPELSADERISNALVEWGKREAELAHDHLVAVLEAGGRGAEAYVIQERVEGATLAAVEDQLRRRKRTLSLQNAARS